MIIKEMEYIINAFSRANFILLFVIFVFNYMLHVLFVLLKFISDN